MQAGWNLNENGQPYLVLEQEEARRYGAILSDLLDGYGIGKEQSGLLMQLKRQLLYVEA